MKRDELIRLSEGLINLAKSSGADEVQISINVNNDFEVQIMNQEIEKLHQSNPIDFSLKVIVDKKVATASSSDTREDTLEHLVKNTVERAKLSSKDEFSGLPEKEEWRINAEELDLFDPKIVEMKPEDKIEFAMKIEQIGLDNPKIKVSSGSYYGTSYGENYLINSNGFEGFYNYTYCYAGGGFQSGDGDNLVEDYWGEERVKLSEMESAELIANKAVERVLRMIGARKVKSQIVPVIFEPQMTSSILRFLVDCISGGSIYMKRSFLVDKLDTKIASDKVNITDNPLMPAKVGSRPFDAEGVASRKLRIIENGILKNYLLDTYSARKLKMKTTGHASGPSNFYLDKGEFSPEEIISSVKNGLYLTKMIGQGTMPTTGDISKGAYGIWIENGKLTYPVSEITFSGNLAEMLNKISMIGNDLDFRRSITGPTIRIDNVSISGK